MGSHGKKSADTCIKCEEACPQHIQIRDTLEKVKDVLLA